MWRTKRDQEYVSIIFTPSKITAGHENGYMKIQLQIRNFDNTDQIILDEFYESVRP